MRLDMHDQRPDPRGASALPYAGATDTEQWEYKIVVKDAKDMGTPPYMESLNSLGIEGWELVSVTPGNAMVKHFVYFFKKRRPGR